MFDVLLVDVFNPKDDVKVVARDSPKSCSRRTAAGDFVRYHYNGTFQDGTPFDSRYKFCGLGLLHFTLSIKRVPALASFCNHFMN